MKNIAKILALYIFMGSMIPRMDYSQLVHLPKLFEHFHIHESAVVEFIYSHFISPDEHHPSNTDQHCCNLLLHSLGASLVISSTSIPILEGDLLNKTALKNNTYRNKFHLTGFYTKIKHPPALS